MSAETITRPVAGRVARWPAALREGPLPHRIYARWEAPRPADRATPIPGVPVGDVDLLRILEEGLADVLKLGA